MGGYLKKNIPVFLLMLFISAAVIFAFYVSDDAYMASRNIVRTLLKPGNEAVTEVMEDIERFFENNKANELLRTQYEELEEENARLKETIREIEGYAAENEELRALMELKDSYVSYTFVNADVIAKNSGIFFYSFTINKGSTAGIKLNDAVISSKGLIGRVSEVGTDTCVVTTLLDEKTKVSTVISKSRDLVVVYGDYTLKEQGNIMMEYIPSEAELSVGDLVETSGIGGVYPGGLLIGTVKELQNGNSGIEKMAVISPVADFKRISVVTVLTQPQVQEQTKD